MTFNELKNTHEEITETATVGKPGYSFDGCYVKIWDGGTWTDGKYTVAEQGVLSHVSDFHGLFDAIK